jgi:hypothetical protein
MNVDSADEYLKDWRGYFKAETLLHFETKGFDLVKTLVLNSLGIFSSRRRYSVCEESMDTLLKFVKKNYVLHSDLGSEGGMIIHSGSSSPLKNQSPVQNPSKFEKSPVVFKTAKNKVPEVLDSLGISHDLDISKHTFLAEYYLAMRKRLTSLFYCAIVDDQDIFLRKMDAAGLALKGACSLVPVFGSLLSLAGVMLIAVKDMSLNRKLARVSDLAINYSDFPDKMSKLMALLRSNAIIQCADVDKALRRSNIISDALYKLGISKNLSPPEMLAFNDTKILEGAILALIETKQINVINFPDINDLQCKVINLLLITESMKLTFEIPMLSQTSIMSGDNSPDIRGVSGEVVFDEEILAKNDCLPAILIRGKAEKYADYYARVNKYLKVYPN